MIFYFSGTGNTRWVAERLTEEVREKCIDMAPYLRGEEVPAFRLMTDERVGFCFPIHAWGVPPVVVRFIERLQLEHYRCNYIYFCCTCGDDIGKTREEMEQLIARKGWQLQAGFSVQMPNTYVALPGFNVDAEEVQNEKLYRAQAWVSRIADFVVERKCTFHITPGAMAWVKSKVFKPFFFSHLVKEKKFRVDASKCVHCGKCVERCPLQNLKLAGEVPVWLGHCCGCLGCYHSCPAHAIEYGGGTRKKGQYYHKGE
jgi:ferredoxin/flavodoxin